MILLLFCQKLFVFTCAFAICSAGIILVRPVQDLETAESAQFGYGGYENGFGGGYRGGYGGGYGAPYGGGYGVGENVDVGFGIPGLGGINVDFNAGRGGLII